jgi:exonuclease III
METNKVKIVTWNCNGALRKKIEPLDELGADIYVIQECEDPGLSTNQLKSWASDYLWIGKNKNKGLGIFSKNGISLQKLNWTGSFELKIKNVEHRQLIWEDSSLELFLPCLIDGKLPLLGVWTKQGDTVNFQYIGQFWLYWQIHHSNLLNENQIICGDFNSNSIWDESDRLWNHTDVVQQLAKHDLHSVYHILNDESQGKESKPTFHLHRNVNKPYHIDYIFTKTKIIENSSLKVHKLEKWLEYSDHLPLEFDFTI